MSSELLIPNRETPYFYIIQHKQSGNKYAGCRYAKNCNPTELLKQGGYTTSSKRVNKIIQEEGLEAFEIVEMLTEDQIGDVYAYETKFLVDHDVGPSDEWFNLHDNKQKFGYGSQKYKDHFMEKFGVDHPMKYDVIKEKQKKTVKSRYGETNPMKCDVIKEKQKKTTMDRYGVNNISQIDEIKQIKAITCFKNSGYNSPFENPEIQGKIVEDRIAKTGYAYPQQNPEVREKTEVTTTINYGGIGFCSEILVAQIRETCKETYGEEFPQRSKIVKDRVKETNMKRFGGHPKVGSYMMTDGKINVMVTTRHHEKFYEMGFVKGITKDAKQIKLKEFLN